MDRTTIRLYWKTFLSAVFGLPFIVGLSYVMTTAKWEFLKNRNAPIYPVAYYTDCITPMAVSGKAYMAKKNQLGENHILVSDGYYMDVTKQPEYSQDQSKSCADVLSEFLRAKRVEISSDKFAKSYQIKLLYIERTEGLQLTVER